MTLPRPRLLTTLDLDPGGEYEQTGVELPVGSVYMNATDPTDPATLLGYGTWERVDVETWIRSL